MSGIADYFPVQRIAQACSQCRRKKCRCTGDRPSCANCLRLGLDCVYVDENPRQPCSGSRQEEGPDMSPQDASSNIPRQLAALEQKLDNFGSQLQRIEQLLTTVLDSNQSNSTGRPTFLELPRDNTDAPSISANQDLYPVSKQQIFSLEETGTPEDVLLTVVDAYFYYCHNQPYSFFHEGNFRRRLSEQEIPTHLVLSVMACAARFCTHPYFSGRAYEESVNYANRAWKLIVSDCFAAGRVAEVATVQTVALLGLFDFTAGRSRHRSAWVKVGIAVRTAQECGLMLETAKHLPYVEQEERRRVFWSVYLLDRLVSCGRGRPPAIVDASCHLQLPCEESTWKNGLWDKTQSLDEAANRSLPIPEAHSTFAQVIVMAQILGRSSQYMLQEFNIRSPHPPWDPSSDFAALESDLLHFETYLGMQRPLQEVLAPHITAEGVIDFHNTGPIIFSRALFHLCYCLLNHPFLLRRRIDTCRNLAPVSFITRSFDLAWQHAQQMIELVRAARELGCSFHSSGSGYCLTAAGSIIALRTYDEDLGVREKALSFLEETMTYIDDIGRYWNNVSSMAVILRRMAYDGFLGSSLCTNQSTAVTLTPAEEETMWAVVDYGTMSNAATGEAETDSQTAVNVWPDSWISLFGISDDQLAMHTGL